MSCFSWIRITLPAEWYQTADADIALSAATSSLLLQPCQAAIGMSLMHEEHVCSHGSPEDAELTIC